MIDENNHLIWKSSNYCLSNNVCYYHATVHCHKAICAKINGEAFTEYGILWALDVIDFDLWIHLNISMWFPWPSSLLAILIVSCNKCTHVLAISLDSLQQFVWHSKRSNASRQRAIVKIQLDYFLYSSDDSCRRWSFQIINHNSSGNKFSPWFVTYEIMCDFMFRQQRQIISRFAESEAINNATRYYRFGYNFLAQITGLNLESDRQTTNPIFFLKSPKTMKGSTSTSVASQPVCKPLFFLLVFDAFEIIT